MKKLQKVLSHYTGEHDNMRWGDRWKGQNGPD
jgi:hypothetical protein